MADYIGISQGFVTSDLGIQIFICKNCRKQEITDKAYGIKTRFRQPLDKFAEGN